MTREQAKQATIQAILGRNEDEINSINSQIQQATERGEFKLEILGNPSVIPSTEAQLYFVQSLGYTIKPVVKYESDRGGKITYQGVSIIWGDEPGRPFENYMENASKTMFVSGL